MYEHSGRMHISAYPGEGGQDMARWEKKGEVSGNEGKEGYDHAASVFIPTPEKHR